MKHRFVISVGLDPVATGYAGKSEEAALAEVLAPFRPDITIILEISAMQADSDEPQAKSAVVTREWRERRQIGCAQLKDSVTMLDLTAAATIAALRSVVHLAQGAVEAGFIDLDDSSLKASGPRGRSFTQLVAAYAYNQSFHGLRYGSRLGIPFFCIRAFIPLRHLWITESEVISSILSEDPLSADRPSLVNVAVLYGLEVET